MTRRVKVDVPNFNGRFDPNVFVDWLDSLENYSKWYGIIDIECYKNKIGNIRQEILTTYPT